MSPPGSVPHALCPPPRTLIGWPSSAAQRTAATTSCTDPGRTITAGSPIPEWNSRAASHPSSSGAVTRPVIPARSTSIRMAQKLPQRTDIAHRCGGYSQPFRLNTR